VDPGIYDDITAEDYHRGAGVSVSTLKRLAEDGGPARVRYGPRKLTKSLAFGSLAHTAFLEPDELPKRYYPVDFILNERSRAFHEATVQAAGRQLVKRADYDTVQAMRDSVMRQSACARDVLVPGPHLKIESSMYWPDPETGLLRRVRPDGMRTDYKILFDLKSTVDASYGSFRWAIKEYRYYWQHPYYCDVTEATLGWEPAAFILFPVEKEAPYLVAPYEIEPADVVAGRDEVYRQLRRFKKFTDEDHWPGLPCAEPTLIRVPRGHTEYQETT
jgi:hypothetical protein